MNIIWAALIVVAADTDINPRGAAMFGMLRGVELSSPVEEAGYGKWLDQASTREEARQDRIHGAAGVMPTPLWIALFFSDITIPCDAEGLRA